MILAGVFAKAIRDGWLGSTLTAVSLGVFLLLAMAVYRDLDLSLYRDLPAELRDLFGFGEAQDAAALAYGAVYTFIGALTLAGLAIAKGSSAIAGEERNGTMGLLLANPVGRPRVLLAKASALLVLTGSSALILWAAGAATPAVIGLDAPGYDIFALSLHIFANALFYGFLALMIGAWSGNTAAAWGVAAAVLAVSYFAAGLLPLIDVVEPLAGLSPWHYYNSADPLVGGVEWSHVGTLLGVSALFAAIGLSGFSRRDLTERSAGISLTDRLRSQRQTRRFVERLEGSARVSRIAVKTASEYQALLLITSLIVLMFGVLMGPMFSLIEEDLAGLLDDYPDSVLALVANADLATPEGWYVGENFSLTLPFASLLVVTVVGGRALAGEEERGTMGLLLANPITRGRVVTEKAVVLLVYALVLGLAAFAGTAIGSGVADLGLTLGNIAAISVHLTLLTIVFGALALALSAATGRVVIATYGTAGFALAAYLLNSFLPLNDRLADLAPLSPFYYYLTSEPLSRGVDIVHLGVLSITAVALCLLAVVLFERRDLRQR